MAQRHQDQRLLRLPRARQQSDAHDPVDVRRHEVGGRLGAAHPVRPGHEQHGDLDRPPRHAARAQGLSPTGPTASPRASCPPTSRRARRAGAQCRHHPVGLFRSQALSARHHRDRQAQADAQRQRPDLRRGENSTDTIPLLDPVNHRASTFKMPVRDPKTPSSQERSDRRRRRTGATRRSGTARPACTIRCTTRRARSG